MQHFSIFLLVLATCIWTVQLQVTLSTTIVTTTKAPTKAGPVSSTPKTVKANVQGKTPTTTVPPRGNQSSKENTSANMLPSVYIISFSVAVVLSFIPKFVFQ